MAHLGPLDSWTQRSSGPERRPQHITSDGSKLLAVGYAPFTGIYRTSTDGSAWPGGEIGLNVVRVP